MCGDGLGFVKTGFAGDEREFLCDFAADPDMLQAFHTGNQKRNFVAGPLQLRKDISVFEIPAISGELQVLGQLAYFQPETDLLHSALEGDPAALDIVRGENGKADSCNLMDDILVAEIFQYSFHVRHSSFCMDGVTAAAAAVM